MTNQLSTLRQKYEETNFEVLPYRKQNLLSSKYNVLKNYIDQISTNEEYNVYEIDSNVEWDDLVQFRQRSECKEFNLIIDKFEGTYTKRFPRGFWDNEVSQKLYMLILRVKLTFYTMESWFQIKQDDFHNNYGGGLLAGKHNDSPSKILKYVYPNYEWYFWKFTQAPHKNAWDSHENQLQYMNWLGDTLRYRKKEDWYQITNRIFADNYGSTLVTNYYNSSPILLLKSIYPEYKWLFWKFTSAPNNSWDSKENQLEYLTCLGKELGYTSMKDWYQITQNDFQNNYGANLLLKYDGSPYKLLKSLLENHHWLFWKFTVAPNHCWDQKEKQLEYMDWLAEELGFRQKSDWYKFKCKDLQDYNGISLMKYYKNIYELLKSIYPTYDWLFFKFSMLNLWDEYEYQIEYIEWLGKQLGFSKLSDWYNINGQVFKKNYGSGLIIKYNDSPYQLLSSVYPEYEWLFWKFTRSPNNHWNIKENQLQYMNSLQKILGYRKIDDWYKVTKNDFDENDGNGFLCGHYNGSPYQLLSSVYPNYKWDRSKFVKQYSKQQIEWLNFLQKYYDINIQHACNDGEYKISDTRYHADGFCRDTNTIYEYHGDYWHGNPKIFQPDDLNKTTNCTHGELYQKTLKKEEDIRRLGYNLITIWESDWMRITNSIRKFQMVFKSHRI